MIRRGPHGEGEVSILVTDDDPGCRDSLCSVFEDEGYETFGAGSGREAVEIIQRQLIHLLILDMHMPDLSGLETLRLIRTISRRLLPTIFITADQSESLRREALRAEACSVVPKPINPNVIRILVHQILTKFY